MNLDVVISEVNSGTKALERASCAFDAKRISVIAKQAEIAALKLGASDAAKHAHSLYADAMLLLGKYLQREPKHEGGRPSKTGDIVLPVLPLEKQGITKRESVQAQMLAAVAQRSEKIFDEFRIGRSTLKDVIRTEKRRRLSNEIKRAQQKKKPIEVQGPFDLILADPPWEYEHCEANNREIENQYPTASLVEIAQHKKFCQPKDDCILFLWATAPKLKEAIGIMDSWGFDYRTCAVWDKMKFGMGYWFRIQHELLLVGIKGSPKATPEPERISSIFQESRGKHSVKPECVYRWIERAFPSLAKLEMYCRVARTGWAAWGNQL